ncbi:sensor histidine kinase [Nakamurella multipartita]|jgi:two-component system OmpR family sensor kinase|nr:HAMP domain-containing sensor histidine kinase [Nakamurella multipartita]
MSSSPPPEAASGTLLDAGPADTAPTEPIVGSDPAAASPTRRRHWLRPRRPLTLRNKLVVGIMALIVVVCAVVGVTTELFLSRYLMRQLDAQLQTANEFVFGPVERSAGSLPSCSAASRPGGPGGFGQSAYSLTGVIVDGQVVNAWTVTPKSSTGCTPLSADADAVLLSIAPAAAPQTVTIPGLDSSYRVEASTRNGVTVVSGLSTAQVQGSLFQLAMILLIVTGVALIAGGFAVVWIVRRSLRPLDRVAATARQVTTLPLDRGEVDLGVRVPEQDTDTRTEVGQVGAALNQMLGHVSGALKSRQESETRVRQFVADASHELRTPLASIRGYAELARRDEHDAQTVGHALRRVESESARMSTLVDDLLLLARLDSGRPLSADQVDMSMLIIDAVSDARVAGATHRWQLDLPEEPVTVIGDGARLHQVLTNLLANARTHTPAGSTVRCGLRTEAGPGGTWAVITVTDDGPGIPAALQPEIFNRFVRGDSSRSRGAGSTGLGLAIVAAVVGAHRGTVTVQSRPGRTVFTVRLPGATG